MSFETQLATPLPKPWCNANIYNLVADSVNSGGLVLTGPFNITESTTSTITGDVGTFNPMLTITTTGTGGDYYNGGVSVSSAGGQVKLFSASNGQGGILSDTVNLL